MKKILSIIPLILLMNFHSFGQYKTANEVIKYINDNLKDYNEDDLKISNSISINSEGQIIITRTTTRGGLTKKVINKALVKELESRVDIELDSIDNIPYCYSFYMFCLNSKCVLQDHYDPHYDKPSRMLSIHISKDDPTKNIADALLYLIKQTKQNNSFLVGVNGESAETKSTEPTKGETIKWICNKTAKYGKATNQYLFDGQKYWYYTYDFLASRICEGDDPAIGGYWYALGSMPTADDYDGSNGLNRYKKRVYIDMYKITNVKISNSPTLIIYSDGKAYDFILNWEAEVDLKNRMYKALESLTKMNLPKETY